MNDDDDNNNNQTKQNEGNPFFARLIFFSTVHCNFARIEIYSLNAIYWMVCALRRKWETWNCSYVSLALWQSWRKKKEPIYFEIRNCLYLCCFCCCAFHQHTQTHRHTQTNIVSFTQRTPFWMQHGLGLVACIYILDFVSRTLIIIY